MHLPIFTEADAPSVLFSNGPSTRGSHRLAEFARCVRAWFFSQMLGLVPKRERSYYVEGSCLHLLLAYHYGVKLHNAGTPQSWLNVPCDVRLSSTSKGNKQYEATALAAFHAYTRYYADETIVPLAIEKEYWASIRELRELVANGAEVPPMPGDDQTISARIDLTCEDKGLVWFMDYKFLAPRGNAFPALNPAYSDYVQNWQFFLQTLIGRARFGSKFGGVLLQRVGKGGTHPMARDAVPVLWGIYSEVPSVLGRLTHAEYETAQAIWRAEQARPEIGSGESDPMEEWLPPPSLWACKDCDYWQLCASPDSVTRRRSEGAFFRVKDEYIPF